MKQSSPIHFSDLSFSYQNQPIVENLSFNIDDNQWVAIVGVNGSGKSTLLKLILGLLQPQKGMVSVFSEKAGSFSLKNKMGSSLQDLDFPNSERVTEILNFVGAQYPDHHSIDEMVTDFQLDDFKNKACGELSGGMKRRLSLACAFIGKPKVVLLDEPSTGLDIESRLRLMKNIQKYQKEQKALVLMISHHPEEVVGHVNQFFHLKDGKIRTVTTEKMRQSTQIRKIQFFCDSKPNLPTAIRVSLKDQQYEVISENSDQFVYDMISQNIPFKNLLISKIGADEMLSDFL